MAKHETCFRLRNDLSELETLRQKLDQFKTAAGIPDKTIFEINLVLDELFSNIVSCGFQDTKEHWVDMTIAQEGKTLILSVQDDGIPFNPSTVQPIEMDCSVEERRIGGIGIHLVKHIVDEMSYRRLNARNVITLKKTMS